MQFVVRAAVVVQFSYLEQLPETDKLVLYRTVSNKFLLDPAINIFKEMYPDVEVEIRDFADGNRYIEYKNVLQAELPAVYETVVPFGAVHAKGDNEYYVYVLKKRNGLFGDEYYPEAVDVNVLFENGVRAAVSSLNVAIFDNIVSWSSGYLIPGETVRVLN